MKHRGGELLTLADDLPIDDLPPAYRAAMRVYLALGVSPTGELRHLLEGDTASALHEAGRPRLLDVGHAACWIRAHLPAYAHGNPAQVGLFLTYVRRARGRAMLTAIGCGECRPS